MNRLVLDSKIELRTGISSGELIQRGKDLFGDVVNNAAFLTKVARAREILIDERALDNSGNLTSKIELIAEMSMKGMEGTSKIYRLNWETKLSQTLGATVVNNVSSSAQSSHLQLELSYQNKSFVVDASHPVFVVGRDKASVTLSIRHAKISRRHCSVYFKQGKIVLEDHSTNGTYVQYDNNSTLVHREAFALIGRGKINLGQSDTDEKCTLDYKVETAEE